jgi:hypothetical protein
MTTCLRSIGLLVLVGCPTATTVAPETAPPPTEPLPAAETLCYRGMSHFSAPDGTSLGNGGVMARRTVDPAASRIVEEVVEYDSPNEEPPAERVLEATVEGDRFTFDFEGGRGSGTLTGEPWAWTAWRSETTLADGMRVVSQDEASGRDIAFRQQVFDPAGAPVVAVEGMLNRIRCEEWETLRPLALSGQLISDMQVP